MQLHMHDAISYPHPRVVEAAHGEETRERQKRDEEGERRAEGGNIGHAGEGVVDSIPTAVCHYSSLSTYQIAQQ